MEDKKTPRLQEPSEEVYKQAERVEKHGKVAIIALFSALVASPVLMFIADIIACEWLFTAAVIFLVVVMAVGFVVLAVAAVW